MITSAKYIYIRDQAPKQL